MAEKKVSLDNWKDQLDKYGIEIPLDVLESAIDTAPQEIRETPDYNFFLGLMFGRQIATGVL